MSKKLIAAMLTLAGVATACSGSFSIGGKSPEQAAAELIEQDLATQLDMTLVAACPELDDPAEGDEFECTATNEQGETLRFSAVIGDDVVNVNTTNVLTAQELTDLEANVASQLAAQAQLPLAAENFECGNAQLVVPDDGNISCALTDPGNGDVYDATLTLRLADGSFDVQVAEDPRP